MILLSSEQQQLNLPNAEIEYYPNFYQTTEANQLFKSLLNETSWIQDDITVFGKTYKQPRLTALYGEFGQPYSYSNITMHPKPFIPLIKSIQSKIERETKQQFNTVLLNLYRDGNDSNGWHADNEKELGQNPVIASLSLGEIRPFHFKHRQLKKQRYKLFLNHGSLLVMKGEMQHFWLHQIAKTKKPIKERINLTFRFLVRS
ncbi:alpha-ketoglutarate-dependent dioxygenase AlkB [Winogradskyella sp. DF17]|jgi:alkylated DNA repair dioxygenase AlkB|uniref:Alpha-ketoglutarate-dependent dioxygenase AlkB n=1 Tax=Winogradskyella pelagia TaxID=2819984 RepID=A0ABS3T210_9FLAO|nr:alpha-ketoglutarate-dependent dioxygenase AlkB [Winogradskyella sp. DF17]MBO3116780.1 alpha-ketoglutarate-dependent dioxygenase AlkB [Winogradskyella sp. DF17]